MATRALAHHLTVVDAFAQHHHGSGRRLREPEDSLPRQTARHPGESLPGVGLAMLIPPAGADGLGPEVTSASAAIGPWPANGRSMRRSVAHIIGNVYEPSGPRQAGRTGSVPSGVFTFPANPSANTRNCRSSIARQRLKHHVVTACGYGARFHDP